MRFKQNLKCEEKYFISNLCPTDKYYNMCWSKFCSQEFQCSLSYLNIWLEQSENENPAKQTLWKIISSLQLSSFNSVTIFIYCSPRVIYKNVAADTGSNPLENPAGGWNFCTESAAIWPFCIALSQSLDLYVSCIWLPLFLSTLSRGRAIGPLGQVCPYVLAWSMDRDYSFCALRFMMGLHFSWLLTWLQKNEDQITDVLVLIHNQVGEGWKTLTVGHCLKYFRQFKE